MTETVRNVLRFGLPRVPERMQALPIDHRGYPVPWFVAWFDGEPDHRVADEKKMPRAVGMGLCWICGGSLHAFKSFVIGPMCCLTRTISEPPSHLECARFAALACPFLSKPHMRRREGALPEKLKEPPGAPIKRNPGVVCLWTTKKYSVAPAHGIHSNPGLLFRLGEPESLEFYAEGRPASREEVDESVRTGLPLIAREAVLDDEWHARQPGLHIRKPDAAQVAHLASVARLRLLLDHHFGAKA